MSRWLTCALCRRRLPVGVMSAQAWGRAENNPHTVYACPECQQKQVDWREQLSRLATGGNNS